MKVSFSEQILQIAYDNNGVVTTAQVREAGISREYLRLLVKKGMLERSERGVYIIPTLLDDEMFNLQMRIKRGIFSHETALFLLDLSDRTPSFFSMTFPLNYNTTKLKSENVKYYRVKNDHYDLGSISSKSPGGNPVRLYNAERTLCDILKRRSNTDIQIITDAFKRYANLNNKDIPLLSNYSKIFRVETRVRAYLEILL